MTEGYKKIGFSGFCHEPFFNGKVAFAGNITPQIVSILTSLLLFPHFYCNTISLFRTFSSSLSPFPMTFFLTVDLFPSFYPFSHTTTTNLVYFPREILVLRRKRRKNCTSTYYMYYLYYRGNYHKDDSLNSLRKPTHCIGNEVSSNILLCVPFIPTSVHTLFIL
jgi:hypothetical protein